MFDTVAIDGDILVYRAASVGQHVFYDIYEDGEFTGETFDYHKEAKGYVKDQSEFFMVDTVLYEIRPRTVFYEEEEALKAFDMQIKALKNNLKAKNYKIYLTGKDNYRESVATILKYKGNREYTEKPYWFYNVREHAIKEHGAIVVNGNEADDACSVVAYRGYLANPNNPTTVCASVDKDLRNTPGYHFHLDKDSEPELVTLEEANRGFYQQLLKGDKTVDNIPGCQGLSKSIAAKYGLRKIATIGEKGAENLLADCQTELELYERCYEVYKAWYSEQEGWDAETETYQYVGWDEKQYERTIDEIIKEQADLLWMQRIKGDRWLKPIVSWSRKGGYECSSKGDKRFSAFNAKMPDGRTIEQHYQCDIKGYDVGGTNWKLGKGKPPKDTSVDLWTCYLNLWIVWASNNKALVEELRVKASEHNNILSDMFATTEVNQARALATILNGEHEDD